MAVFNFIFHLSQTGRGSSVSSVAFAKHESRWKQDNTNIGHREVWLGVLSTGIVWCRRCWNLTFWNPAVCCLSSQWLVQKAGRMDLLLGAFAKLQKSTVSSVTSVLLVSRPCVHIGTIPLQLRGFSWDFVLVILLQCFTKITVWLKSDKLCLKSELRLWHYPAEFVLDWEKFQF